MYKILGSSAGCNTARMYRITRSGELIALFMSLADAEAYVKSKRKGG